MGVIFEVLHTIADQFRRRSIAISRETNEIGVSGLATSSICFVVFYELSIFFVIKLG